MKVHSRHPAMEEPPQEEPQQPQERVDITHTSSSRSSQYISSTSSSDEEGPAQPTHTQSAPQVAANEKDENEICAKENEPSAASLGGVDEDGRRNPSPDEDLNFDQQQRRTRQRVVVGSSLVPVGDDDDFGYGDEDGPPAVSYTHLRAHET